MLNNLAEIEEKSSQLSIDIGCGKAIFDDSNNPKKRYFLEKRWGTGNKILTVIMTNPSSANSLSSDNTVEFLLKYARASTDEYDALYVVNIIPLINPSTKKLDLEDKEKIRLSVKEKMNKKCIEYAISNSNEIIIAWGGFGQTYIRQLIEDEELKNVIIENSSKVKVFGLSKKETFPRHPRPNNSNRNDFDLNSKLIVATDELKKWINNRSRKKK
ncbi:hypothetical protein ATL39_2796 [Sinobaca qinghaiensis]|uniref:DUF1643 domain-containing protein n=1 Tax=Sinobaca qinghaiensis TaxID=342944 RepID=A0A419V0H2_9BACL|nr:DUF1643 domain-containing protein [Sinobaca qinghaiensis]RKD71399.1 hypothetical protein ATL39_2796 [Sinobaca qinghaiensis]